VAARAGDATLLLFWGLHLLLKGRPHVRQNLRDVLGTAVQSLKHLAHLKRKTQEQPPSLYGWRPSQGSGRRDRRRKPGRQDIHLTYQATSWISLTLTVPLLFASPGVA